MIFSQLSFQDAKSPTIILICEFHDYALSLIIFILTLVILISYHSIVTKNYSTTTLEEGLAVEAGWTAFPSLILISLASRSLALLYEIETRIDTQPLNNKSLTVKTVGHQWYWSYEYADFQKINFDAYIVPTTNLHNGQFRVLEADNRIVLPWNSPVNLLVTSADVLHAWTIPSLGVKADAVPGRLNLIKFSVIIPGTFYGQCSEICGANHSFIPIALERIKPTIFIKWVNHQS